MRSGFTLRLARAATWLKWVSGIAVAAVVVGGLVAVAPGAQASGRAYDIARLDVAPSGTTLPFAAASPDGSVPSMSGDGRFVALLGSELEHPAQLYLRDRLSGITAPLTGGTAVQYFSPAISADGTTVAQAATPSGGSGMGDDVVDLFSTNTDQLTRSVPLPITGTPDDPIFLTGVALDAKADRLAITTHQRTAGADTAYVVNLATGSSAAVGTPVMVVSGVRFPDALSAAAVAGRYGGPVLLVSPTVLPSATAAALKRLAASRLVIVGGAAAISASVQSAAAAAW